jgi:SOS-response transcriptional repressor LexA
LPQAKTLTARKRKETHMTNVLKNQFNQVCEILNKYDNNHYKLIPILQEIQEIYQYLPESNGKATGTVLFANSIFKQRGRFFLQIAYHSMDKKIPK